ncbi:unnamed protein product [Cochlearia groenlandica]
MAESSKKKTIRHKAWSLVRMALLWGRKGGVFKRWHFFELRNLLSKHLKALSHPHHTINGDGSYLYRYGERQLSFDDSPLFNVKNKKKTHRPASSSIRFLLPCIDPPPHVEFGHDFEMDGQDYSDDGYCESCTDKDEEEEEEEEKGVDLRAEEFIAKFYDQIKLQRQIS